MYGIAVYRPLRGQVVDGLLWVARVYGANVFCVIDSQEPGSLMLDEGPVQLQEYGSWAEFRDAWSGSARLLAVGDVSSVWLLDLHLRPEGAIYVVSGEGMLPSDVLADCDWAEGSEPSVVESTVVVRPGMVEYRNLRSVSVVVGFKEEEDDDDD